MRESDIMHENGLIWVGKEKDSYTVFVAGITCSIGDSSYSLDSDGLSIAIARCDYLAKGHKTRIDIDRLFDSLNAARKREMLVTA